MIPRTGSPAPLPTTTLGGSFEQSGPPEDPSAPLRRFPVSIMVRRPNAEILETSLLHLTALHPRDELEVRVGDKLTRDWTLCTAYLAAGQRVKVQSWDLWDKRWKDHVIRAGRVPEGDVVPLIFLVLNRDKDNRVGTAIQRALESSSEQIVSQSAIFETTYAQQNRLYEFLSAYAALGPKAEDDPVLLRDRIFQLNEDLGMNPNPYAQPTTPGDVQRALDASYGLLSQLRENPDNQAPTAQALQGQLPTPVADWVGLVSDLMKFVIHPRKNIKVSFIPASATEARPEDAPDENWMELVTERVPETKDQSLPVLVYKPTYDQDTTQRPAVLEFAKHRVVSAGSEVVFPIDMSCRDLFVHPYAWDWEMSRDQVHFSPIPRAKLLPGAGLEFPIDDAWWAGQNERSISIRARLGFVATRPINVEIARAFPQKWIASEQAAPDLAVGDSNDKVTLVRSGGATQPFYDFALVTLTDSAGAVIPCLSSSYAGSLTAWFDLAKASPGPAQVRLRQDANGQSDPPVTVYIAPKRANISVAYAQGDRVVRVSGPDAGLVTTIKGPNAETVKIDDSDPAARQFVLNQPLPSNVSSIDAWFKSAGSGTYVWQHTEPINVGSPRPRIAVQLVGSLPSEVPIGSGSDPTWAMATLPPGWFRTKQPVKLEIDTVSPYKWTHDVVVDLGFGPSVDVQKAFSLTEGANLSIDTTNPTAISTLSLDSIVIPGVKRMTGLVWIRATTGDLSSGWTLATLSGDQTDVALRAVRLPTITSFDTNPTRTHVVFSGADQLMAVKIATQAALLMPQLLDTTPATGVNAAIDLPSGTTEFDMQLQDSAEGFVHVKLLRNP